VRKYRDMEDLSPEMPKVPEKVSPLLEPYAETIDS
jgi:hypothetical protein